MDAFVVTHAAALCILLALSAFISGSEAALFSLQKLDLEKIHERNEAGAHLIISLLEKPKELIAAILLTNEVLNVGAASVSASLGAHFISERTSFWEKTVIITGFSTIILLIFGEITPKIFAIRSNLSTAEKTAPIIHFYMKKTAFVRKSFLILISAIMKILRIKEPERGPSFSESVLMTIIDEQASRGEIDGSEKELIEKVLSLDDTSVSAVMRKIEDVFMLPQDEPLAEILTRIGKMPYSRIPVYAGGNSRVPAGILYVKDLMPIFANRQLREKGLTAADIMRAPVKVSADATAERLLRRMRKEKFHIALVTEKSGSIVGIVALEDLLEELVGEIHDEKDLRRGK